MKEEFQGQFSALIEKYTELMLGDTSEELQEKIKMWALYTHISKTMPPLAKHWNSQYPDAKKEMIDLVREMKELNERHRENQKKA
jgi:hypothetical protein